jgi:hypothetical protein
MSQNRVIDEPHSPIDALGWIGNFAYERCDFPDYFHTAPDGHQPNRRGQRGAIRPFV